MNASSNPSTAATTTTYPTTTTWLSHHHHHHHHPHHPNPHPHQHHHHHHPNPHPQPHQHHHHHHPHSHQHQQQHPQHQQQHDDSWIHVTTTVAAAAATTTVEQQQQQQQQQYHQQQQRPTDWDWYQQVHDDDDDRKPHQHQILSSIPTTTTNYSAAAAAATALPPALSLHSNAAFNHNYTAEEYHRLPNDELLTTLSTPTPTDNLNAQLRSYHQRRQFLGLVDSTEDSSRSEVISFNVRRDNSSSSTAAAAAAAYTRGVSESYHHARIGLNLGGRTYFSSQDSAASTAGRLTKRSRINLGIHIPMCQVQGCNADLSKSKHYHRRHKVCEIHSKAPNVIANGHTQRFCQQCSRFHHLSEFDEAKRSCRKRLADHNRRRRKPQSNAIITLPQSYKLQGHYSNFRSIDEDPKAMLYNSSPTESITDRNSVITSAGGNRLQQIHHQSSVYGLLDDKIRCQTMPSSDVQALVLSVVSRSPSATTQDSSVYQQFMQGATLSLSSANQPHQSSSTQNSLSEHSAAAAAAAAAVVLPINWLTSASSSRSDFVQTGGATVTTASVRDDSSRFLLQQKPQSEWTVHNESEREQLLGRLGLITEIVPNNNVDHQQQQQQQMLAPLASHHHHHQQHPLHHQQQHQHQHQQQVAQQQQPSDMQSSGGVRSSFGSSFYDSSSSVG